MYLYAYKFLSYFLCVLLKRGKCSEIISLFWKKKLQVLNYTFELSLAIATPAGNY